MSSSPVFIAHNITEARKYSLESIHLSFRERILKYSIENKLLIINALFAISGFFLFKRGKPRKVKETVVFTSGILGDTIIMAGAIAALKEKYNEARITVVTNCQKYAKGGSEILSEMPYVDKQIFIDDKYISRRGIRFRINNNELSNIACDLFINLSPFGRRGWSGAVMRELILAKLLKSKWAFGFSVTSPFPRTKTQKIIHYFCVNEPRRAASILSRLNLSPLTGEQSIPINQEKRKEIETLLTSTGISQGKLFAAINPGAKNNSKCWSPVKFGKVARWLFETYGFIPVLTGSAIEYERCETVNKASGSVCVNLAGKTDLAGLIELLRLSSICVSNDTGPMHVSGCLGKPTVGIFAARWNAEFWFPQGDKSVAVFSKPFCALCIKDPFLEDEDPIICLEDIDIGSVQMAIKDLIPEMPERSVDVVS